jgi:hypothetical protein
MRSSKECRIDFTFWNKMGSATVDRGLRLSVRDRFTVSRGAAIRGEILA